MVKKIVLLMLGTVLLTLLLTTVAWAWTPQEIYNDFAEHGKLTRDYTDAELRASLRHAGFTDVESYDGYRLTPPTITSDRVFYTAVVT